MPQTFEVSSRQQASMQEVLHALEVHGGEVWVCSGWRETDSRDSTIRQRNMSIRVCSDCLREREQGALRTPHDSVFDAKPAFWSGLVWSVLFVVCMVWPTLA
jgi:hypothetical protein